MSSKHELWELQSMQAAPLSTKISMTKQRIREWVNEYGEDGVYVSFSGGKDSTVLLHLVREMYPNVPAVYCNTGLEYPEITQFVKSFDNVEVIKPKKNFFQVCEQYGFPLISKEVSECVSGARKYLKQVLTSMEDDESALTDRQTDRQTDRSGIIRNSVSCADKASIAELTRQVSLKIQGGWYDRKYRKLRGSGEFSTDTNGRNSTESGNMASGTDLSNRGVAQPETSQTSLESERLRHALLTQGFGKTIDNLRIQRLMGINSLQGKVTMESIPSNDNLSDRSMFSCERYQFFLDAPFEISNQCCTVMKKEPMHRYQKETGRNPMTAEMASESRLRTQVWLRNGCNMFDAKNPKSTPLIFWTEQDILLYIYENHIPIASVYGDVIKENEVDGQLDFADLELFDLGRPTLKTTGCQRTGCILCGYGAHRCKKGEKGRYERLKETHPRYYNLLNVAKNSGWTMAEAIEWTNEHGRLNIR